VTKKAFDKIAAGFTEALTIAKGEADPATYRVTYPIEGTRTAVEWLE
jgi:hypothetical protein